jgi:hypothetical protein
MRVAPVAPGICTAPRPFRSVVIGSGLVTLVEVHLDSGIQYVSYEGISSPGQWWEDTLISIGSISRDTPLLPEEPRISNTTIVIDNTNRKWSTLKATEPFRNRKVVIRRGDASLGAGGIGQLYTGEITDYRIGGGVCELTIRDVTYDRFRSALSGNFNPLDFPNMPVDEDPDFIPIVYGRVEGNPPNVDGTGLGALPAHLVEVDLFGEAQYIYVIARHPCKAILDVYRYGVLVPQNDYRVTLKQYGEHLCQVIIFKSDPRDSQRGSERDITLNAEGITEDGGSAGRLLTNPVEILEHYMTRYIRILQYEIHAPSFKVCKDALEPAFYNGGFAIVKDTTHDQVIANFQMSFNMFVHPTRFGQLALYMIRLDTLIPPPIVLTSFTDSGEILDDSFELGGIANPVSRLQFNFSYNYSNDVFLRQPDDNIPEEEIKLNREIRDNLNLWYVRDQFTASEVASDLHQYRREETQVLSFELPTKYDVQELHDHVFISHWEGISSSGSGYVNAKCRVTGLHYSFDPSNMSLRIDLVRIPETPPVATTVGLPILRDDYFMALPTLAGSFF